VFARLDGSVPMTTIAMFVMRAFGEYPAPLVPTATEANVRREALLTKVSFLLHFFFFFFSFFFFF